MVSSEVQRTLVKSPPELWAELSDPEALARHLGEFGEIRVTRVEPEKTVEWEAADTTGKVTLAPSGWGTKVTLAVNREPTEIPREPAEPESAAVPKPAAVDEAAPEPEAIAEEPLAVEEPEPAPELDTIVEELEPEPRLGFFARLFRRRHRDQIDPETLQPVEPELEIEPEQPAVIEIDEPEQPQDEETPDMATSDIAAELKAAEEVAAEQVTAVLTAVLDRLGAAHHRPFSRA